MNFDQLFGVHNQLGWYEYVQVPVLFRRKDLDPSYFKVKFFSKPSAFIIQKIIMRVTEQHLRGWSFNGNFESQNIIMDNDGVVHIVANGPMVPLTADSCRADYVALHDMFGQKFIDHNNAAYLFPVHFDCLLDYFHHCPAGVFSGLPQYVSFVNNHPSIERSADRMKQILLFDIDLGRHGLDISALFPGFGSGWIKAAQRVDGLRMVLHHDNKLNQVGTMVTNALYTDNAKGLLHFASNFLKHGTTQKYQGTLILEAAFSLYYGTFSHDLLHRLTGLACRSGAVISAFITRLLESPNADWNTPQ